VHLLDARRRRRGHVDQVVDLSGEGAAAAAGHADRDQAHLTRLGEGGHDARRAAGRADAHGHVAPSSQGLHLPPEDGVVAEVVGDGRQDRGVGGEGDGAPGRTILEVTPDELGREVLGVGGGAPVAEGEDLAAGTKHIGDATPDREDVAGVVGEIAPLQIGAVVGSGAHGSFIH